MKYVLLIIAMISLGAGSFTSLLGWQNTPFEYNAYLQGLASLGIFAYLMYQLVMSAKDKVEVTNARDLKSNKLSEKKL